MPTPSDAPEAMDLIVDRNKLDHIEIRPAPAPGSVELAGGQVLLAIDAFALTANNITYAVFGEAMNYWDFFPAPQGYGRVPVWGFALIVQSAHPGLSVGERVFGYFPMSTHLRVDADAVTEASFNDGAAHRSHLHPLYNHYVRTHCDPGYEAGREAEQMLFRPLFTTAFLIDDLLAEEDYFGASQVLLSSASSKTAVALAQQLSSKAAARPKVVGLTSAGNAAFVAGLGCYDEVVVYDELEGLDPASASVFVDMAGNANLLARVHSHFDQALNYSCQVGATHYRAIGAPAGLPGPAPVLFFAPDRVALRSRDWGPQGLQARIGQSWARFVEQLGGRFEIDYGYGPDCVKRVYLEMLGGQVEPQRGCILSLNDGPLGQA